MTPFPKTYMWNHFWKANKHVIYSRQEFLDIILHLYVACHYGIDPEHTHCIFSEGFNLQNLNEMYTICSNLKKRLADFTKNYWQIVRNCFLGKHFTGFILTGQVHSANLGLVFEENILSVADWIKELLIIVKERNFKLNLTLSN